MTKHRVAKNKPAVTVSLPVVRGPGLSGAVLALLAQRRLLLVERPILRSTSDGSPRLRRSDPTGHKRILRPSTRYQGPGHDERQADKRSRQARQGSAHGRRPGAAAAALS